MPHKLLITVRGGVVQEIRSDLSEQELAVTICDFDSQDEEVDAETGRVYDELTAECPHVHGDC
jgi:hypothetical protein